MNADAVSQYVLSRGIFRLTQRAVQEATLAICSGPLSPLTEMQSIQLRVALGAIVRDAIGVGRWYERQARDRREAGEVEADPRFDEEPTEPALPSRR